MDDPTDAPAPDLDSFYDSSELGLTCRICGCLVANAKEYPKVHWDWHEATPGA